MTHSLGRDSYFPYLEHSEGLRKKHGSLTSVPISHLGFVGLTSLGPIRNSEMAVSETRFSFLGFWRISIMIRFTMHAHRTSRRAPHSRSMVGPNIRPFINRVASIRFIYPSISRRSLHRSHNGPLSKSIDSNKFSPTRNDRDGRSWTRTPVLFGGEPSKKKSGKKSVGR